MNLPTGNLIGDNDSDVYTQVETALCIWEYVLEQTTNQNRSEPEALYNWFTQEQGVYAGRSAAIDLAWLVERAYQVGNGGDKLLLDGLAFDWEIVPYIIETWAELFDYPAEITAQNADHLGASLPVELNGDRNAKR